MGLVVGIAGVSRAGKSTLAAEIKENSKGLITEILSMDDFVVPEKDFPKINGLPDWESPATVDYLRLIRTIREKKLLTDLLLLEGILIYNNQELRDLMEVKFFVDLSKIDFFSRKKQDNRWRVPEWYVQHIWDSHLIHGTIHREDCYHLKGSEAFDIEHIMSQIFKTKLD